MIQVKNLIKEFEGRVVLNEITTDFKKGVVNMIIGKSGSGKTVFLKCLIGLIRPTSGEIRFNGRNIIGMKSKEMKRIRRDMGVMFQGSALFDSRTVLENVMFPLDMFSRMNLRERRKRAEFCLERVNLLHAADLFPSEISGGMMKRVAIARAIALNPKYLFCDEPNSGLDPKTSQLIDELISDITADFGMTSIVVSHDINSVMNIGDNIIFLNEGVLEWEGSKDKLMSADNEKLNEFIFASDLFKKIKKADTIISDNIALGELEEKLTEKMEEEARKKES